MVILFGNPFLHSPLIQSVTTVISYAPSEQLNGHYFGLIGGAIESRFVAVLHDKSFQERYQSQEVMTQIMNGLEVMVSGTRWFPFTWSRSNEARTVKGANIITSLTFFLLSARAVRCSMDSR